MLTVFRYKTGSYFTYTDVCFIWIHSVRALFSKQFLSKKPPTAWILTVNLSSPSPCLFFRVAIVFFCIFIHKSQNYWIVKWMSRFLLLSFCIYFFPLVHCMWLWVIYYHSAQFLTNTIWDFVKIKKDIQNKYLVLWTDPVYVYTSADNLLYFSTLPRWDSNISVHTIIFLHFLSHVYYVKNHATFTLTTCNKSSISTSHSFPEPDQRPWFIKYNK